MCAAPKGNQFWKARSSHGRKPIFPDPETLWNACEEYFQWAADNPLMEEKVFCHQGTVTRVQVPHMRAMTISGLCLFLDIGRDAWGEYGKREGFADIVTRAEEHIYQQKFTGAAVDMLNANIIARDLGLKDKKDIAVKCTLEDLLADEDE